MSLFRHSEPVALQCVWNAILVIRKQRQIANISRITKIIQKEHSYTPKEILHHILRAVKDNMVVETISLGCKGSKAGMEQEGYWIPEHLQMLDIEATHDWYCFKCHKPGDMVKCSGCVVAFHLECIEDAYRPGGPVCEKSVQYCKYCQLKHATSDENSASARQELNKCLGFIARCALNISPELATVPDAKDHTHYEYFIKEHQNLNTIIEACNENKFEVVSEFVQKTELVLHNCTILHGEKHRLTHAAKMMLEACNHELKELSLCKSCYLQSNTKPKKDWFCIPCNPPHQILWAKQRGFGYWPAKVIQIGNGKVDVRFFGGHHERAWVGFDSIESIILSPTDLHIKKTKSWQKANDEMKEYVRQTEKAFGSVLAAQVVKFDYRFTKPAQNVTPKKETVIDAEVKQMKERAMKRRREMVKLARPKKRKIKATPSVRTVDTENPNSAGGVTATETVLDVTSVDEVQEWEEKIDATRSSMSTTVQVKVFGQKAKLNEECARTWPYAKELILSGLFRYGYKLGETKGRKLAPAKVNQSSQTEKETATTTGQCGKPEHKPKHEGCDCKKRYEGILMHYKACVRRMRNQERRRILASSALFINRKLMEEEKEKLKLQDKICALQSENEILQRKLDAVNMN